MFFDFLDDDRFGFFSIFGIGIRIIRGGRFFNRGVMKLFCVYVSVDLVCFLSSSIFSPAFIDCPVRSIS